MFTIKAGIIKINLVVLDLEAQIYYYLFLLSIKQFSYDKFN